MIDCDFDGGTISANADASFLGARYFGLALGYEDLVDHDELRKGVVTAPKRQ